MATHNLDRLRKVGLSYFLSYQILCALQNSMQNVLNSFRTKSRLHWPTFHLVLKETSDFSCNSHFISAEKRRNVWTFLLSVLFYVSCHELYAQWANIAELHFAFNLPCNDVICWSNPNFKDESVQSQSIEIYTLTPTLF